jgi:hypothetical protein
MLSLIRCSDKGNLKVAGDLLHQHGEIRGMKIKLNAVLSIYRYLQSCNLNTSYRWLLARTCTLYGNIFYIGLYYGTYFIRARWF